MKTKTILAVSACLLAGLEFQTSANATLAQAADYSTTLYNQSTAGLTATLNSEYLGAGPGVNGTTVPAGDYQYVYWWSGVNESGTPPGLASLSVYYSAGVSTVAGSIGGTTFGWTTTGGVLTGDTLGITSANWTFSPLTDGAAVYFDSPDQPTLGYGSGQDGGLWGANPSGNAYGVVVPALPNVPDGGYSLSLLGGAFLGMGVLRRKLSC